MIRDTPDGICSLPCGHKDLEEITKFKENLNIAPQDLIKNYEKELFSYEQKTFEKNERMRVINTIICQQSVFHKKRSEKRLLKNIENQYQYSTRDYLLQDIWRITP